MVFHLLLTNLPNISLPTNVPFQDISLILNRPSLHFMSDLSFIILSVVLQLMDVEAIGEKFPGFVLVQLLRFLPALWHFSTLPNSVI